MPSPRFLLLGSFVLGLLLTACGSATPHSEVADSPLSAPTATPAPSPTVTPSSVELIVLHTNDNWGETEPCG